MEKSQLPYRQYGKGAGFPQHGLIQRTHSSINYGLPPNAAMAPFGAVGSSMVSSDAIQVCYFSGKPYAPFLKPFLLPSMTVCWAVRILESVSIMK